MNRTRIEVNRKAVVQLLKSDEVRADLEERAREIARAAGAGMSADSTVGRTRARAYAWTDTWEARRAEARGGALRRAIDAGGY
jgi:hypothetical protein